MPSPTGGGRPRPRRGSGGALSQVSAGFGALVQPPALWLPGPGLALVPASPSVRAAPQPGCAGVQGAPEASGVWGDSGGPEGVSAVGARGRSAL